MTPPSTHRRGRSWLFTGLVSIVVVVVLLVVRSGNNELLTLESGGEGTTAGADRNAFGNSARNLTNDERRRFEIGDSFFTQNWVIAPSSTDKRDGLGPLFNARSCSSCHLLDGRGSPEEGQLGLLVRLSVPGEDGPLPDPTYGGQIQDNAIPGVPVEGLIRVIYNEEEGVYADGDRFSLRRPLLEFDDLGYGPISIEVMTSARLAPPVFGAGLIEAIPEEDLLAAADPDDADGDGISGRPNYVTDIATGETVMGRFGWKANVASVEQQVASAFVGDIGITSPLHAAENCTIPQVECANSIHGGSPEIGSELFGDVVFYNKTLAVPARRNLNDPDVESGARVFSNLGCAGCHTPRQETGADPIAALADQVIFPFTDLLLHDMGPGLADGRPDGLADGSEWRTPPLWGLGLTGVVNGHEFFLHDGRARTIEEAILWHGGEADAVRDRFIGLDGEQRDQLIAFLESL